MVYAIGLLLLTLALAAECQVKDNDFCEKHPNVRACQKEETKFDDSWSAPHPPPISDGHTPTVARLPPPSAELRMHDEALLKEKDESPPSDAMLARRKFRIQTLKSLMESQGGDAGTGLTAIPLPQRSKRSTANKRQKDYIDDEEYEYYMWRKKMRRMGYRPSRHYHNSPSYGYQYPNNYYYPSYSSYPSYGGGYSYPSYGGGYGYPGGYGGGGYGQAFNLGFGSGLNIGLPYGMGVGIGSGFGLNVGK